MFAELGMLVLDHTIPRWIAFWHCIVDCLVSRCLTSSSGYRNSTRDCDTVAVLQSSRPMQLASCVSIPMRPPSWMASMSQQQYRRITCVACGMHAFCREPWLLLYEPALQHPAHSTAAQTGPKHALTCIAVGGVGFGKDASATSAVKKFFHRARPSDDLHHSFSFPSGHSTSAYFTLAFLFFVIVPALASWSASLSQPSDSSSQQPSTPASGTLSAVQGALQAAAKPKAALALTIGGGMITQSGRLLADVHWVSDVLAGALWGSSGVALACVIIEGLRSEPARLPAATGENAAAEAATGEGEKVSSR